MTVQPLTQKNRKDIAKEIEVVRGILALFPKIKKVAKKYDGKEPSTRNINRFCKELKAIDSHLDVSYAYSDLWIAHIDNSNPVETNHCIYTLYCTTNVLQIKDDVFDKQQKCLEEHIDSFDAYMTVEQLLLDALTVNMAQYNDLVSRIPSVCRDMIGIRVSRL